MARRSRAKFESTTESSLNLPLDTVLLLFRATASTTLDQIVQPARLDAAQLSAFNDQYDSVGDWLTTYLKAHDPSPVFEAAIAKLGTEPDADAADLLREAMRQMIGLVSEYMAFFELALIEADVYHGGTLDAISSKLLPVANNLLQRIKQTDQLRPLPDWLIARALVALLIGFVASERAMPSGAQFAARLMPQRLWIDSLTDILAYGLIEDEARK